MFSIPNSIEEYNGNLEYFPKKGLFLKLKDLPLNQNHFILPIMQGRIYGDPYSCTLLNVRSEGTHFSGNPDGLSSITECMVDSVLLGMQIPNINELFFDQIKITYSNFREWINKPSIFTTYNYDEDTLINIKKLPNIQGNLNNLFDFEIEFHNYGSYPSKSSEISIKQGVTFNIISKNKNPTHLNELLKINTIVKYFFMFLQGSYVLDESITCIKESKNNYAQLIQFQPRFAKPKHFDSNTKFKHPYDSIHTKFEKLIITWIETYTKMPDFFNAFFENVLNDSLFTYDKFENLYQSLLFYYNYKFKDEVMSEENYALFIKTMKNKLDIKEQQFIERFSNLGNRYSLSKQLDQIFTQLEFWRNDPVKRKRYIQEIVKTRNKISHASVQITQQSLIDTNRMTINLTNFISTLILHELNFSK